MNQRLGLSLSGGGFRATLFHLGVVRFLREADLLKQVTDICSVSGGSILAAHLVQHWDRYALASLTEFDDAANDVIRFVRMDVRGRITRRFLPLLPVYVLLKVLSLTDRFSITRFGVLADRLKFVISYLLQRYYLKHLYARHAPKLQGVLADLRGPLPGGQARPRLYMLAANLTTGGLCTFTNDGLSPMKTPGTPHSSRGRSGGPTRCPLPWRLQPPRPSRPSFLPSP